MGEQQVGKALSTDTWIPTPDGGKYMRDIMVGDTVYSGDGQPCRVVFISPVEVRPTFVVTFDDNTFLRADKDHLWVVVHEDGRVRLRNTEYLWRHKEKYRVPIAKPIRHDQLKKKRRIISDSTEPARLLRENGYHVSVAQYGRKYMITPSQKQYKEIVSIEPSLPSTVKCISVDSFDGTYLAGDGYTVTHNTTALMLETVRYVHLPGFYCVVFRNSYKQIMQAGGLWDMSMQIYPHLNGKPERKELRWVFPSGARIEFSYLSSMQDALRYKGGQFALIIFDQLEEIGGQEFFYMVSRNRTTCGINPYLRAGCNPDPDSWLANFISWWINPDTGYPIEERGGKIRWYIRVGEEIVWGDTREELIEIARKNNPSLSEDVIQTMPRSVAFIPATIYDNPALLAKDPGYIARLLSLPPVERERLLYGNWRIRPTAGSFFNRTWFEIVDEAPNEGYDCRFWDMASTEPGKNKDPDETAAVKCRYHDGKLYVLDVIDVQQGPADVEELFIQVTLQDQQESQRTGIPLMVRWEQEPGSAGKRESYRFMTILQGVDASPVPSVASKTVRAKPLATQARAGNVKILRAPWNEKFLTQMHNFASPDAKTHDDIVDATAGAYNALVLLRSGSFGMF